MLSTGILVLTWIHRANHNARQLGADDMRFTPGWAVGWYFVPIAWFWKPYQAMKEIWLASANPSDWRGRPVSPLLPGGGFSGSSRSVVLILIAIIRRVHDNQMAHYRRQVADGA